MVRTGPRYNQRGRTERDYDKGSFAVGLQISVVHCSPRVAAVSAKRAATAHGALTQLFKVEWRAFSLRGGPMLLHRLCLIELTPALALSCAGMRQRTKTAWMRLVQAHRWMARAHPPNESGGGLLSLRWPRGAQPGIEATKVPVPSIRSPFGEPGWAVSF